MKTILLRKTGHKIALRNLWYQTALSILNLIGEMRDIADQGCMQQQKD